MAIALRSEWVKVLEEKYTKTSLTSDLISNDVVTQASETAKEIKIPKMSVAGLGDYSRANGYESGSVDVEYQTVTFTYDRGIKIEVDTMDDKESANLIFANVAKILMETAEVPEDDAFTFASICKNTKVGKVATGATLSTGDAVVQALRAGITEMDNASVAENRILYITPAVHGLLTDMDSYKSKAVLERFSKVIDVPPTRFVTAIDLKAKADGFGFKKSTTAADINFMMVDPSAIIKAVRHTASDIVEPADNQTKDAYMMKYRKNMFVDVYDEKVKGVYYHHKATA